MATVATEERPALKASALKEKRLSRWRDGLRFVMDSPQGRLYMSDLIGRCGVLKAGYVADSNRLQFEDGQRNIGVMLLADILRDAPRSYLLMEQEQAQRAAADKREDEAAEKDDEVFSE